MAVPYIASNIRKGNYITYITYILIFNVQIYLFVNEYYYYFYY